MAERFAAEAMKAVLADIEEGALVRAEAKLKAGGATVLAVRTFEVRLRQLEIRAPAPSAGRPQPAAVLPHSVPPRTARRTADDSPFF